MNSNKSLVKRLLEFVGLRRGDTLQTSQDDIATSLNSAEVSKNLPIIIEANEPSKEQKEVLRVRASDALIEEAKRDKELLFTAIHNKDFPAVKQLLEGGVDCDFVDEDSLDSPVDLAAHNGSLEIVKLLLTKGLTVSLQGDSGVSAVYSAVSSNNIDMVKALIDAGAKVTSPGFESWREDTTLNRAIYTNNIDMINLIIEGGALVNAKAIYNEGCNAPLYIAIAQHSSNLRAEIVQTLIDNGANIHQDFVVDIREVFTESEYSQNYTMQNEKIYSTPLLTAMKLERDEVVEVLLNAGVDIKSEIEGLNRIDSNASELDIEKLIELQEKIEEAKSSTVRTLDINSVFRVNA